MTEPGGQSYPSIGQVGRERLEQLMNASAETQNLDYKSTCDLSDVEGRVKLAHDIACMAAGGGYLVIGVDDRGSPTGMLDATQAQLFDEANLMSRLRQWLPSDVSIQVAWHTVDSGDHVVLIHVDPATHGIVIMASDGQYPDPRPGHAAPVIKFRCGQIVTRTGTQNGVMDHSQLVAAIGMAVEAEVAKRRDAWRAEMADQFEHDLRRAGQSTSVVRGEVTALSWQLPLDVLTASATQMIRTSDRLPIRLLLLSAREAGAQALSNEAAELSLDELLDRIVSLAALAATADDDSSYAQAVDALMAVYCMTMDGSGTPRAVVGGSAVAQRKVLERAEALGGLLVRLERFDLIPRLVMPASWHDPQNYWQAWMRQAFTFAARAEVLSAPDRTEATGGAVVLLLAQDCSDRLPAVRPDASAGDERILDSIAQFDALACQVAMATTGVIDNHVYWPSYASFYGHRTAPIFNRLVRDTVMRDALGLTHDSLLADAMHDAENLADNQVFPRGWDYGPGAARDFVEEHRTRPAR